MVSFTPYEPLDAFPGIPVVVLVTHRVGPSVCIPLHSLPDRAAHDLLVHFAGETEEARGWWDEMKAVEPFGRLVWVVGDETARAMLESLGGAWPDGVEVVLLYG